MAVHQAAGVVKGIREAMQNILEPETRQMRAEMRAIRNRLEALEALEAMDKRFDRLEDHLSTYGAAQTLKEQMAELRARQQPSA